MSFIDSRNVTLKVFKMDESGSFKMKWNADHISTVLRILWWNLETRNILRQATRLNFHQCQYKSGLRIEKRENKCILCLGWAGTIYCIRSTRVLSPANSYILLKCFFRDLSIDFKYLLSLTRVYLLSWKSRENNYIHQITNLR